MRYFHLLGMLLSEAESVLKSEGKVYTVRETRDVKAADKHSNAKSFADFEARVVKVEEREDGEISVIFCMIPCMPEA